MGDRGRVLLDTHINRPKGNAHLTFFKVFFLKTAAANNE